MIGAETASDLSETGSTKFNGVQTLLTSRGLILALFLFLLISGPVLDKADIVACAFAWSALAGIFVLALITLFVGIRLKHRLFISLGTPSRQKHADLSTAGSPIRLFITLSPLNIPTCFRLEIQAIFEQDGISSTRHVLQGAFTESDTIFEDLIFPHRGEWSLQRIAITFSDFLGLSKLNWEISQAEALAIFKVSPGERSIEGLPVLSSSHRSGDLLSDSSERHGDPFDLKPYHPSDGIKRILWKVYARRGELIARHPERAMTPEGQVAIFAIASEHEDALCASTLNYIRKLCDLDLELYFACHGLQQRELANTLDSARDLMIASVWDTVHLSKQNIKDDLSNFLNALSRHLSGNSIERLLIFCSPLQWQEREALEEFLACCGILEQLSIQPVIICVRSGFRNDQGGAFNAPEALTEATKLNAQRLELQLLDICAKRKWESILVD